jgi:hypothetical protein
MTRTIDEILKEMDDSHAQFSEPPRTEHPLLTSALRRAVDIIKRECYCYALIPGSGICKACKNIEEVTCILNGEEK